jgi:hypothetical protein
MSNKSVETKNYKIHFVKIDEDLQLLVEALNNKETIYTALVFDENRKQYGLNIYSILMYDGDVVFVFNSHTLGNIEKLWAIFENENICKVTYSCSELVDFLALHHCRTNNIYDLQIAGTLANQTAPTLLQLSIDLIGYKTPQRTILNSYCINEKYYLQLVNAAHCIVSMELLLPEIQKQLTKTSTHRFVGAEMKLCETSLIKPISIESFANEIVVQTNQCHEDSFDPYHIIEDLLQFQEPLQIDIPKQKTDFPWNDPWNIEASIDKYSDYFKEEFDTRKNNFKIHKMEIALNNLQLNQTQLKEREQSLNLFLEKKRILEEKYVPVLQRAIEKFGEHAANYLLRNVKESFINLQFPSHKLHQHQIDIVSLILLELNLDI